MKIDRNTTVVLIVIFAAILVCVTVLIALGRPADSLISLITVAIVPALAALISGDKTRKELTKTQDQLENVNALVNGNTSRLLDIVETYGVDVSEARKRLAAGGVAQGELLDGAEAVSSGRHVAE